MFAFAETLDSLKVRRIAGKVEATNTLDRSYTAIFEDFSNFSDCLSAAFNTVEYIDLWSAIIATDRLGIIAPRSRIIVLFATFITHRKGTHTRALTIVGHLLHYRQARTTICTVDKRVEITTIAFIKKLSLALVANGNIRRHKNIALFPLTFDNLKIFKHFIGLSESGHGNINYRSTRRGFFLNGATK